jgi:tRNA A37 threonylcarbamoyladenosine dehydratase
MSAAAVAAPAAHAAYEADLERRFGGLRRLYGDSGYERIRAAHVVVVGVGGVGSWTAEALARSGVAALTLVDLDQVSESNINRQVQAVDATVGQAKVTALAERIAGIHPGCAVHAIEEFVEPDTWPRLLPAGRRVDAAVDACDQGRAKLVLAAWALATRTPLIVVGAAGGKRAAEGVAVTDLGLVTHDPMLATLRQRLRRHHGAPRSGPIGLACVHSREAVRKPEGACDVEANLNCHGYGSSVAVTATFGMVAAGRALESVAQPFG